MIAGKGEAAGLEGVEGDVGVDGVEGAVDVEGDEGVVGVDGVVPVPPWLEPVAEVLVALPPELPDAF